jgi:tetratricopeptide (TPR) repeat protein
LIGPPQLRAGGHANNKAPASAAVDAVAGSGQIGGPGIAKLYSGLAVKLYKEKQFGESARLFERAVALNPADQGQVLLLGDAQLAAGNKSGAMATYQRVLQARRAAGQKPDEELYRRIVQAAYDAQLPSATELAREWVVAYPSPASWRNSIAIYRNLSKPDVEGALDLFRLMRATGALTNGTDLTLYLSTLSDQSNFVEAQTALEQTNVTGGDGQLQVLASSLKSKPRPSEADLAAAAKNAQSAMSLLRIGDRLYGMGAYAKAADVYRQAKGKGAEADLANLRTGIALAGAGDKAGATAALKSVGGPRAGVAQLWLLYLEKKA